MSGLLRKVQNCLGVASPVRSPEPPAGSTAATGKSTLRRPGKGSLDPAPPVREPAGSVVLLITAVIGQKVVSQLGLLPASSNLKVFGPNPPPAVVPLIKVLILN
uniref:Uncharacterized protein n=1 Tax=Scleropages formosus TaxID=113540 RepID=A0A8C9SZE7_SCLFO